MTSIWKRVAAWFGRPAGVRRAVPRPAPSPADRPAPSSAPAPARTPGTTRASGPVRAPGPARTGQPVSSATRAPARLTPTATHAATGRHLVYAPELDGQADPGEIVWTWVAYEDDPRQGKDRPVLVVGRQGSTLLGLMLSSQHERDGQRGWFALGPGVWDRQARPSWVRLDRVLEVDEDGIRREGAVLDRTRFDAVARALRTGYGWA